MITRITLLWEGNKFRGGSIRLPRCSSFSTNKLQLESQLYSYSNNYSLNCICLNSNPGICLNYQSRYLSQPKNPWITMVSPVVLCLWFQLLRTHLHLAAELDGAQGGLHTAGTHHSSTLHPPCPWPGAWLCSFQKTVHPPFSNRASRAVNDAPNDPRNDINDGFQRENYHVVRTLPVAR